MQLKLVMALFGSGTHFPLGVFDNSEDIQKAIAETTPSNYFVLDMNLNENWEVWRREESDRRRKENQIYLENKEARFKDLNEKGHIVRKGRYGDRHITFDGDKTLCGFQLGRYWVRPKKDQDKGVSCSSCYERSH